MLQGLQLFLYFSDWSDGAGLGMINELTCQHILLHLLAGRGSFCICIYAQHTPASMRGTFAVSQFKAWRASRLGCDMLCPGEKSESNHWSTKSVHTYIYIYTRIFIHICIQICVYIYIYIYYASICTCVYVYLICNVLYKNA